jgi:hypothetical protein
MVSNYYTYSTSLQAKDWYWCCYIATYLSANKYLWRESTTWTVPPYYSPAGDYVILEVLLYQYSNGSPDDEICRVNYNYGSTNTDDVIFLKNK